MLAPMRQVPVHLLQVSIGTAEENPEDVSVKTRCSDSVADDGTGWA